MTEYWKSTAKKYCEFCNCWITDDKATRDIHDKGLRHQQNVSKRIDQVKKKAVDDKRIQQQLSADLLDIEKKAYLSMQKDVMQNAGTLTQYGFSSSAESMMVAESLKAKIKQQESKMQEEEDRKRQKLGLPALAQPVDSSAAVDDCWQEEKSPEGYIYYYNAKTKQKQWERPKTMPRAVSSGGSTSAGTAPSTSSYGNSGLQLPTVKAKPTAAVTRTEETFEYRPGEKRLAAGACLDAKPDEPGPGRIKLRPGVGGLLLKKPKTEK